MNAATPPRFALLALLSALTACASAEDPPHKPAEHMVAAVSHAPSPVTAPAERAGGVPSGIGYVGPGLEPEAPQPVVVKEVSPYRPVIIRVTGSGTMPVTKSLTLSQRKLLSLRAARLDAFRAIAEQVQGMKLVGNSSVANMVSINDGFRTYVDAYLRGVNVVSSTWHGDGTSDVVAEIVLDQDFYKQFKSALERTGSVMKAAQEKGATGAQCAGNDCGAVPYNSNFYVAQ